MLPPVLQRFALRRADSVRNICMSGNFSTRLYPVSPARMPPLALLPVHGGETGDLIVRSNFLRLQRAIIDGDLIKLAL